MKIPMKWIYWSLDIKVGIPQVKNTKSSRFLATIRAITFCQGNASIHPENKHIKTITYSNPKEERSWLKSIRTCSKCALKSRFLAMSHFYSFPNILLLIGSTWPMCLYHGKEFHRDLINIHLKSSDVTK